MAANALLQRNSGAAGEGGPLGLTEGRWVRTPLVIASLQAGLNFFVQMLGKQYLDASISASTVLLVGTAAFIADPQRTAFRVALHAANASVLIGIYNAVFLVGYPDSLILFFTPIVLLSTAHMLGARAALLWSLPCFALAFAGELYPPAVRLEASAPHAIVTDWSIIATLLAFAISLRRAYDRKAIQLERLATTDALTGLANRVELQLSLRHALSRAERFGRHGALVFIDVDGLKAVNDRLGHDAGDVLLRELAGRLRKLTRGIDVAARLGGDEFVVLLSEYDDPKGAEIFSRKLLAALRLPCRIAGEMISPSASIGFAEFPAVANGAEALLARADEAMYAAKQAGGSRIYRAHEASVAEIA